MTNSASSARVWRGAGLARGTLGHCEGHPRRHRGHLHRMGRPNLAARHRRLDIDPRCGERRAFASELATRPGRRGATIRFPPPSISASARWRQRHPRAQAGDRRLRRWAEHRRPGGGGSARRRGRQGHHGQCPRHLAAGRRGAGAARPAASRLLPRGGDRRPRCLRRVADQNRTFAEAVRRKIVTEIA